MQRAIPLFMLFIIDECKIIGILSIQLKVTTLTNDENLFFLSYENAIQGNEINILKTDKTKPIS